MQENLDLIWVLIAAFLVFMMQAGFTMLETGFVRAKNSVNIAMKNVVDFMVGTLSFWLVGFGLMFGASQSGLFGVQGFMLSGFESDWDHAFFVFQLMFAATAATIVSGCVAERMSFRGYALISVAVTVLIYPLFGHWAWHGEGWLSALGFMDFAGSTVVHLIGAAVGLAGTLMLGPRHGRFDAAGKPVEIPSFNLTLVTLGVFLLWFGWFGFNGGSGLKADGSVAVIVMNTVLGAAAGGAGAFAISLFEAKEISVTRTLNGILGGLVAITAGANLLTPGAAVVMGTIGGVLVYYGEAWLLQLKIDDPVGAIPVHGVAGAWGTLGLALTVSSDKLATGDWLSQLGVQALGVAVAALWASLLAFGAFWLLKRRGQLRVPLEHELIGLNVAEHGVRMSWVDTVHTMRAIVDQGDYSRRVEVEIGTEAGDVAASFNTLLGELEAQIAVLNRVSQGDLQVACPLPKSERDVLALSIGRMVSSLKDLIDNLESKVAERTGELAEKNRTLQELVETIQNAQKQLIEAEKMAALGSLVAGVSHEINTPVGVAVTAASHLEEKLKQFNALFQGGQMKKSDLERFVATVAESVRMLLTNLARAADLVQSFKRVAVDQSTDETQQIGVRRYLEELLLSLRPQFKNRPVEVVLECDEALVLTLPAGPFSQVVTNLLMNALLHAFGEGEAGRIVLRVAREPSGEAVVDFSDNGRGIDAAVLPKIFDPFFTTKRGQGGTGLGLHILYNIITQQLGGTVEVQSEAGKGTRFLIRFLPAD